MQSICHHRSPDSGRQYGFINIRVNIRKLKSDICNPSQIREITFDVINQGFDMKQTTWSCLNETIDQKNCYISTYGDFKKLKLRLPFFHRFIAR